METLEEIDVRMIAFENEMNRKMNLRLVFFGLFLINVLVMMGIITKIFLNLWC